MSENSGAAADGSVRLNKYLSECGVVSRRKADDLITEGAVIVNGKKVYELGTRIQPGSDRITVNGRPVKEAAHRLYILFNKPKNVVTTMDDPEGRPTVADYFSRLPARVFPVGRLDWDTEGMILLTNDGEFAQSVNHPSEEIMKTYLVKVNGHPTDDHLARLKAGVSIVGGRVQAHMAERIQRGSEQYDWIKILISEGKNRQIRHMFEKIGFDVIKLQRVAIGRLRMPSSLKRGEYLFLTEKGTAKIFQRDPEVQAPKRPGSVKRDARNAQSRTESSGSPRRSTSKSGARLSSGSKRSAASHAAQAATSATPRTHAVGATRSQDDAPARAYASNETRTNTAAAAKRSYSASSSRKESSSASRAYGASAGRKDSPAAGRSNASGAVRRDSPAPGRTYVAGAGRSNSGRAGRTDAGDAGRTNSNGAGRTHIAGATRSPVGETRGKPARRFDGSPAGGANLNSSAPRGTPSSAAGTRTDSRGADNRSGGRSNAGGPSHTTGRAGRKSSTRPRA